MTMKCFGECYRYDDCEICIDFDECYDVSARKKIED